MSTKSSSVYDHVLATWAMELSYTAYNYPNGDELFDIPGAFMGDVVKPADVFLREHGFTAEDFNYGHDESAAHVIAHRNITIASSDESQENNNEGANIYGDDTFHYPRYSGYNRLSAVCGGSGNTGRSVFTDTSDIGAFQSEVAETTDGSAEQDNTSGERQLVVVDIRGSVTALDFIMDVLTQFHVKFLEFEDGCEMVMKSLYGYDNCTECTGDEDDCSCIGYLERHGIENPIILVTGHSLGAAIANLVAAELNESEEEADVYAYTFATPNVKSATDGNAWHVTERVFSISVT